MVYTSTDTSQDVSSFDQMYSPIGSIAVLAIIQLLKRLTVWHRFKLKNCIGNIIHRKRVGNMYLYSNEAESGKAKRPNIGVYTPSSNYTVGNSSGSRTISPEKLLQMQNLYMNTEMVVEYAGNIIIHLIISRFSRWMVGYCIVL